MTDDEGSVEVNMVGEEGATMIVGKTEKRHLGLRVFLTNNKTIRRRSGLSTVNAPYNSRMSELRITKC